MVARRGPPEAELAQRYYRQALTLAEELSMRPLQAHCHRGLGMPYAMIGKREQAHTALATAINWSRVGMVNGSPANPPLPNM
jgi:hypothetical protein